MPLFCLFCETTAWATDFPMIFIRYLIKFWSNTYRSKIKAKLNLVLFCIAWFCWLWCGMRSPCLQWRISLVLCCYNDSLGCHESSLWWATVWGCSFLTRQSRNETCCHLMSTYIPFCFRLHVLPLCREIFSPFIFWYPHTHPWHISSVLTNILF